MFQNCVCRLKLLKTLDKKFFEKFEIEKSQSILYRDVGKNDVECTSKSTTQHQVLQNCGYRLKVLKNGNLSHGSLKKDCPADTQAHKARHVNWRKARIYVW